MSPRSASSPRLDLPEGVASYTSILAFCGVYSRWYHSRPEPPVFASLRTHLQQVSRLNLCLVQRVFHTLREECRRLWLGNSCFAAAGESFQTSVSGTDIRPIRQPAQKTAPLFRSQLASWSKSGQHALGAGGGMYMYVPTAETFHPRHVWPRSCDQRFVRSNF